MTEQEAFEKWLNEETRGWGCNHWVAEKAWQAACEWQRQQQEADYVPPCLLCGAREPCGDIACTFDPSPRAIYRENKRLRQQLETMSGCKCQCCGNQYFDDLLIPDELWEQIKPEGKPEGAGLLCPQCIYTRLQKQQLEAQPEPVAWITCSNGYVVETLVCDDFPQDIEVSLYTSPPPPAEWQPIETFDFRMFSVVSQGNWDTAEVFKYKGEVPGWATHWMPAPGSHPRSE